MNNLSSKVQSYSTSTTTTTFVVGGNNQMKRKHSDLQQQQQQQQQSNNDDTTTTATKTQKLNGSTGSNFGRNYHNANEDGTRIASTVAISTTSVAFDNNNNDNNRSSDYGFKRTKVEDTNGMTKNYGVAAIATIEYENDDEEHNFTTMYDLLAVPVSLLYAEIPTSGPRNTQQSISTSSPMVLSSLSMQSPMSSYSRMDNRFALSSSTTPQTTRTIATQDQRRRRRPLLSRSEAACFLQLNLLAQQLDSISYITTKVLQQRIEYQSVGSKLVNTATSKVANPYLIPVYSIVQTLSTSIPDRCMEKIQRDTTTIIQQLDGIVDQLRHFSEQNWNIATSLIDEPGVGGDYDGIGSGTVVSTTTSFLAQAKNQLSMIQDEICTRIERYILLLLSTTESDSNPTEDTDPSSLFASLPCSMKDYCLSALPYLTSDDTTTTTSGDNPVVNTSTTTENLTIEQPNEETRRDNNNNLDPSNNNNITGRRIQFESSSSLSSTAATPPALYTAGGDEDASSKQRESSGETSTMPDPIGSSNNSTNNLMEVDGNGIENEEVQVVNSNDTNNAYRTDTNSRPIWEGATESQQQLVPAALLSLSATHTTTSPVQQPNLNRNMVKERHDESMMATTTNLNDTLLNRKVRRANTYRTNESEPAPGTTIGTTINRLASSVPLFTTYPTSTAGTTTTATAAASTRESQGSASSGSSSNITTSSARTCQVRNTAATNHHSMITSSQYDAIEFLQTLSKTPPTTTTTTTKTTTSAQMAASSSSSR